MSNPKTSTAPTRLPGDSTNALATTAFVMHAIGTGTTVNGAKITLSTTAPVSGNVSGDLWWETDTGILYIYYNDGNSSQWVVVLSGVGIPDAPNNGVTYGRKNLGWVPLSATATVTIADTAPPGPFPGQLWYESDSGFLFVWYVEPGTGGTSQWVAIKG